MADDTETITAIYAHFNARDVPAVLEKLTPDVVWANAMEGGHVHGHDAVQAYWTRQWSLFSPHVEPLAYDTRADDSIVVEVRQTVLDLDGRPLAEREHGLRDKTVMHVFRLRDGKVCRFDVTDQGRTREAAPSA